LRVGGGDQTAGSLCHRQLRIAAAAAKDNYSDEGTDDEHGQPANHPTQTHRQTGTTR
jgi:hypothetical protein